MWLVFTPTRPAAKTVLVTAGQKGWGKERSYIVTQGKTGPQTSEIPRNERQSATHASDIFSRQLEEPAAKTILTIQFLQVLAAWNLLVAAKLIAYRYQLHLLYCIASLTSCERRIFSFSNLTHLYWWLLFCIILLISWEKKKCAQVELYQNV